MRTYLAILILGITLAVLATCAALPDEQEGPTVTFASGCPPLDYRTPGYRHPWEPITDRDKDPRSFA